MKCFLRNPCVLFVARLWGSDSQPVVFWKSIFFQAQYMTCPVQLRFVQRHFNTLGISNTWGLCCFICMESTLYSGCGVFRLAFAKQVITCRPESELLTRATLSVKRISLTTFNVVYKMCHLGRRRWKYLLTFRL